MEYNKEEATRAKEMAERKMESKDFVNAKKVAEKAQKLYPDLKDISQLIVVCDVHCAARNKVSGNENDWYGILQVEPTADETVIKKQYRKLALLLHPDKNQLTGASDAFKFVGEAQKVLLDREKRIIFDRKCKASGRYPASNWTMQQGSRQPNHRPVHSWFQNVFPPNNATQFMNQDHQQNNQQTQSGPSNPRPTFWTACPFCSVRYQFYKELINKNVRCQNCQKEFLGCETNAPNETSGTNFNRPINSQQKAGPSQNHRTSVHQGVFKKPLKTGNQGGANIDPLRGEVFTSEKVLKKNRKKRSKIVESSESSDSDSSISDGENMNIEEDNKNGFGQNSESHSERNPRRSSRSTQKVTYDDNPSSDDDLANPSKRSKSSESFRAEGYMFHKQAGPDMVEELKDLQNERKEADNSYKKESVPEDDETNNNPETFEYPEPDFSDFDKERKEECFAAGQIWACYDTLDAMPRFYALIRKVQLPGFKLQLSWLEPTPDDKDEINWVREGLPVSCGKFRHGIPEICEDHGMFAYLASWEKGSKRNSYQIYPREGETWAIFKDWDINRHFDPLSKKKYEFEFVEVLSSYVDNVGVQVAYLGKLKGFICLFCRTKKKGVDSFVIPIKQMFRFSHKVPSVRMTGKEGENVPAGSFELDPASLPSSHVGVDVSETIDMVTAQNHLNGSCSKSSEDIQGRKNESPTHFVKKTAVCEEKKPFVERVNLKADASQKHFQNPGSKGNATTANVSEPIVLSDESETEEPELKAHLKSSCNGSDSIPKECVDSTSFASDGVKVPDPIFYDFDADKTLEKLEIGQIWAVYMDEDTLPKYYGRILKIDSSDGIKVTLTWLISCPTSKVVIPWKDTDMPICCGKFRVGRQIRYDNINVFSHMVKVESTMKQIYTIYPQKGDIWALYKDWSPEIKLSELGACEYQIVEVLMRSDHGITVIDLEQVDGYKSIFKPKIEGQSKVTKHIPMSKLLSFSHQIPAFRLTEEANGSLRDFWELDPAAMPQYYFLS